MAQFGERLLTNHCNPTTPISDITSAAGPCGRCRWVGAARTVGRAGRVFFSPQCLVAAVAGTCATRPDPVGHVAGWANGGSRPRIWAGGQCAAVSLVLGVSWATRWCAGSPELTDGADPMASRPGDAVGDSCRASATACGSPAGPSRSRLVASGRQLGSVRAGARARSTRASPPQRTRLQPRRPSVIGRQPDPPVPARAVPAKDGQFKLGQPTGCPMVSGHCARMAGPAGRTHQPRLAGVDPNGAGPDAPPAPTGAGRTRRPGQASPRPGLGPCDSGPDDSELVLSFILPSQVTTDVPRCQLDLVPNGGAGHVSPANPVLV